MDITIIEPDIMPPAPFVHSISMTIRSFKGRRDVDVHLFRCSWDPAKERNLDWDRLVKGGNSDDPSRTVMESFTTEERDRIVNYLKEQYSTRLTTVRSVPLTFPVPAGLPGLSQLTEGKNIGIIEFQRIPSYKLGLPIKGLYDLSQHPPIADE